MMRIASIKLDTSPRDARALTTLQSAYAEACNRLVPTVCEHRCWNRVALHKLAYSRLRAETPLGSQMACNAIFSVCKAYRSQRKLGRIEKDGEVPVIRFDRGSVHYDRRTYRLMGESVSLYRLDGRIVVPIVLGNHQRRILASGKPKEAELVSRNGQWFFNLVVESGDNEMPASGAVMGVDVGENNLAAVSLGRVFGGGDLRHRRDQYLALRRRLQSNGSQSAKQKLRQVSGKEARRVKHVNHETSKAIVTQAVKAGISRITLENLTHIAPASRRGNGRAASRIAGPFGSCRRLSSTRLGQPASGSSTSIWPTPARPAPAAADSASGSNIVSCANSVVCGRTPT